MPAALLSMIAACAVTAEGKQTIRGIGNERNGANRALSGSSNITAPQTMQIRGRFLNLKSQVVPYKNGENMQQGGCNIIRGVGDPSLRRHASFLLLPQMREHFPGSNESLLIWAASATQIELSSLISDGGKRISLCHRRQRQRECSNRSWSPSL